MKYRRIIIFLCLLLLCLQATQAVTAPVEGNLRFMVISDSHLMNKEGAFHLYPATERIVKKIIEEKPDFVVHCGDMISINPGSNSRSIIQKMWGVFNRGARDRILGAGIPFYPSPGNHDVYGRGKELYEQQWKSYANNGLKPDNGDYAHFYSFRRGENLFISLDGSGISIPEGQLRWLRGLLKDSSASRIFVFSHVGLIAKGRHPEDTIRGELAGLIRGRGNVYFISGHQHVISIDRIGSATHIISGSAGETPPYYYLLFKVDGGVKWEVHKGSE
jgi:3',5'-cyclic AMP phosphodiesterase CpdA